MHPFKSIALASIVLLVISALLVVAEAACQIGCTCNDPNCNCEETGQCETPPPSGESPPDYGGIQQGAWQEGANRFIDDGAGITIKFPYDSPIPQVGYIGSGTPQAGVSTNDPALMATASQIEAKKQQINDKYSAYQRGEITYAQWWEFRNEEVGSAQWIAGQWAALARLIGELSADQPIPDSTSPTQPPNLPLQ